MKRIISTCIAVSMLAACAHRPPVNPDAVSIGAGMIVDGKGRDQAQIMADGRECYQMAEGVAPVQRAAAGAVAGAVVGALLGALIFRSGGLSGNRGAGFGAGYGALGGASGAGAGAVVEFRAVLRNCMIGRGHVPLN